VIVESGRSGRRPPGSKTERRPEDFNFGQYPRDFFDFIIIDECHRGGANDESSWRDIMEYFSPAVQLGLTATPKRDVNGDTYKYFGEPIYTYALKEGINDGFLTPFKVKEIQTNYDEYTVTADDTILDGEAEVGDVFTYRDYGRKIIEIQQIEAYRVKKFLELINQKQKTLVFCATQKHAALIRDLINQHSSSKNTNYCHRVTADDGKIGEQHLRDFQDNEKSIPTVLTTSQKLSTGVDAPEIRNIVLLRPVRIPWSSSSRSLDGVPDYSTARITSPFSILSTHTITSKTLNGMVSHWSRSPGILIPRPDQSRLSKNPDHVRNVIMTPAFAIIHPKELSG
jgi:type I site-specific restriction endonuclease